MSQVFLNQIATAVPPHEIHQQFSAYAPGLLAEERRAAIFKRMAERCQIDCRYSFLEACNDGEYLDKGHFYRRGFFPSTAVRMQFYQEHAFKLVKAALMRLSEINSIHDVTHLIVTSCTGFYAPGIDLQVVSQFGLKASTERTFIGFMGCYAAFNALKLARHIVRSEPRSKVMIINLELCTLHLQETDDIEELLSFLIFGDGCATSIVSSEPYGLRLDSFNSAIVPMTQEQITWTIGDDGFDMTLSGKVPGTISGGLPSLQTEILGQYLPTEIAFWGIHPGGRTVLDAVQRSFDISDQKMTQSRDVLRRYGNMSSATVMFVLKDLLATDLAEGVGCSMAFGPGVTVESMMFHKMTK